MDADDDQPVGQGGWRRIHSASRRVDALVTALRSRADVLEVEPNFIVHTTSTIPNDPLFSSMWGLLNSANPGADIHAASAWDISRGSTANVVGMVDTGIDYTHADLAGNVWTAPNAFTITIQGTSFTCPAGSHGFNAIKFAANDLVGACDPMDDNGHGTHTAGTVGAVGNNALGVTGVNWTASLMAMKFLDSTGSGAVSDAVNAIDFAIQTKAAFATGNLANVRVLSNSWGGPGYSSALQAAIERAAAADMLFVAAAGNSSSNDDSTPFYPASLSEFEANMITVAATDPNDLLASFSNYGSMTVQLGAPGVNIVSTWPSNQYATESGTSMATPHVAGAAALLLSVCNLTTSQLKTAILNNVDLVTSLTPPATVTGGRLDADKAIRSCFSPPTVTLTSPANGAGYTAPATVTLGATAIGANGIAKVEFYQGTTLIGTATTSPYGGTWSSVPAGTYTVTAKAYDTLGLTATSAPATITVSSGGGPTSATFAGVDTATQGTWKGVYGTQAYTVVGDSLSWPAGAAATPSGEATYQFAASTTDVRGLQQGSGSGRVAYVWYGSTWTLDVNLSDGAAHQLAVYLVDWDTTTRAQQMQVRDAVSGTLLDVENASGFNGGQYWKWTVTGHVTITFTRTAGWNAVVSGVFLDAPDTPPTVTLTSPTTGATYPAPATIPLAATANASSGISRVEFYAGTALIGTATAAPYTASWTIRIGGAYSLTAKAYDTRGGSMVSAAVPVTVTGGVTSVTFAGVDTATQGTWKGVYGTQAYTVVGDSLSWPAGAAATPSGEATYQFAASTTDVRGLQQGSGSGRVAYVWYGSTWTLDVNLSDGAAHQLALYLVDWDTTTRAQQMQVRDAVSGTLLDVENASGFNGGQYWKWTVTGHVTITFTRTAGWNAVVSGVFLDAPQ